MYPSVDKALDIYYLSIAYLSTMRNWTSRPAFRIARFLFYYRLVGVALFEVTDERLMLLLFPNTFEYFFIAYEVARLRYEPERFSAGFWLLVATGLWIASSCHSSTGSTSPGWTSRTRCATTRRSAPRSCSRCSSRRPSWSSLSARACPLPIGNGGSVPTRCRRRWSTLTLASRTGSRAVASDQGGARAGVAARAPVRHLRLDPAGIDATVLQIGVGVTAIVLANAAISLAAARRGAFGLESAAARYAALLATNLVLVYLANALLGERRDFVLGYGIFFAFLFATIIWLYDAFRPVYDRRFRTARA